MNIEQLQIRAENSTYLAVLSFACTAFCISWGIAMHYDGHWLIVGLMTITAILSARVGIRKAKQAKKDWAALRRNSKRKRAEIVTDDHAWVLAFMTVIIIVAMVLLIHFTK